MERAVAEKLPDSTALTNNSIDVNVSTITPFLFPTGTTGVSSIRVLRKFPANKHAQIHNRLHRHYETQRMTGLHIQFVIHEYAHARAVLEAAARTGVAVTLVSAPGAVRTGGAGWWRELVSHVRNTVPHADVTSILDCADEPGMALAAIREGVEAIAISAPDDTLIRLSDVAAQSDVTIRTIDWAQTHDLAGANDPQAMCENLLREMTGSVAKPDALG
jgi:hypothetical protein